LAGINAVFDAAGSALDRVSGAGDVFDGFDEVFAGFAIIGGALACVAALGDIGTWSGTRGSGGNSSSPASTAIEGAPPRNRQPPSISRAQCQSIVANARKEYGGMWKDSIRDPWIQKSCEREIQQAQSDSARRDATSCLNAISLAKSRTPNGRDWRHYIPKSIAEECGIQTPQDSMSSPPSLDTGEPHDVMCRRVIDTSKQRFGVRWLYHIHPVRVQQCREEILSQIQYDRERCQHSTACDVSALPTEADVPNLR